MTHAIAKVCAAINTDDAGVHLYADEMRDVIDALDERERAIGRERTRADDAEAECARLTTERDLIAAENAELYRERHELALVRHALEDDRDAARAEAAGLRAVVGGRATAPAPADVAAHAHAHPIDDTGTASNGARRDAPAGLWLCVVEGDGVVVLRLAVETDDQGPYLMAWSSDYGWCGTGDIRRAWPLTSSGCPWPTVAAEAATGAALAGEGRTVAPAASPCVGNGVYGAWDFEP